MVLQRIFDLGAMQGKERKHWRIAEIAWCSGACFSSGGTSRRTSETGGRVHHHHLQTALHFHLNGNHFWTA
jgi:hypothetical protein